jgi:hypothetical protein
MKPTRSEATKAGQARARARGAVFGNPNGAAALRRAGCCQPGWTKGAEGLKRAADAHAAKVRPIVELIQAEARRAGIILSLREIARELTARGAETMRGGSWGPSSVRSLLARIVALDG